MSDTPPATPPATPPGTSPATPPATPPGGAHAARDGDVAPPRWASALMAVTAGFGAGLLGTSLHAQGWWLAGLTLPWGVVAAWLLLAAVELYVGLWSRTGWAVVVGGAAAYLCAGLLSVPRGGHGLISGNFAGNAWLVGIALVTVLMLWLTQRLLRTPAAADPGRR